MTPQPDLDIVIIGLNSAKTLKACIDSVRQSHYPQDKIRIIYADGGSGDGSQELARSLGAEVVLYEAPTPTPGGQRNVGWQHGTAPWVQFLDSDTRVDPDWLAVAVAEVTEEVGAVCGDRRELNPDKSVFNWIGDQEWNAPAGDVDRFGGDVLVSRKALEETGGYNPGLIGGEDPELGYRVTKAGYRILKVDHLMTWHDLAMYRFRQYWKRSFRTGHAFVEVNTMHPGFASREVKRILVRGGLFFVSLVALPWALVTPWSLLVTLAALGLFLAPRWKAKQFEVAKGLTKPQARVYSWNATLVVVPQLVGILRFWAGRLAGKPLTNRKLKKRFR